MSSEAPAKDRLLPPEDRALHPGWELIEFLASIGADEFTVSFMYAGEEYVEACDSIALKLAPFSLGQHTRECTVTHAAESNRRPVEVWHLNARAREALREIFPDGVVDSHARNDAWAEDLCVYRCGELLLGTIRHERYAFLRLTEAEWRQWEAQRLQT